MTGPIFVGGTGRSGTSLLLYILGQHPDVHAIGRETRLLIDPGGLEDLAHALTDAYTPFHAVDALDRLEWMLTERVTGAPGGGLPGWDLLDFLGPERFAAWTRHLIADLTWYEFDEFRTLPGESEPTRFRLRVGLYFADRAELIALIRRRIDELFGTVAAEVGRRVWCEKTPLNMLSMPFLWELFPTARLVHVVRHPVQVVASHVDQPWAPSDIESICAWLEPLYRRWFASVVRDDRRCRTVRLEDLAADWSAQRTGLFDWLGLPDTETELTATTDRTVHERQLDPADEAYVAERLGFAVDGFGYR